MIPEIVWTTEIRTIEVLGKDAFALQLQEQMDAGFSVMHINTLPTDLGSTLWIAVLFKQVATEVEE